MTIGQEEEALRREHHRRIRWVKRLLRPLPRRATIHRYPGLGWFAGFARRRAYLWSFRTTAITPALWAGSILTFLPVYGVQIPIACVLSIILRANLPVLVGLQLVTNPITMAPVYFMCFEFGHFFLKMLGVATPQLTVGELKGVLDDFLAGNWGTNAHFLAKVFGITTLGGVIFGTFVASISTAVYRVAARRAAWTFARIRELQHQRESYTHATAPKIPRLAPDRRLFRKGRRWR